MALKRKKRFWLPCAALALACLLLLPFWGAQAQSSIDKADFGEGFGCVYTDISGFTYLHPAAIPDSDDIVDIQPIGKLFDTGSVSCQPRGMENIFSNFVCAYENIISEILSNVYCRMQLALLSPIRLVLTLFVVVAGAGLLMGTIPGTAKELVLVIFKVGLIYFFVTEPSGMIGIVYRGLMGFIQDSVGVVMSALGAPIASGGGQAFDSISGQNGILRYMDQIVTQFIGSNATRNTDLKPCESGIISFIGAVTGSVPLLAIFVIAMALQLFLALLRGIFGYLVALTSIMFLISMAPLFLSFALFKTTHSYFSKWVQQLLGFSVQIFVVFAVLSMVMSLQVNDQLRDLFTLLKPFDAVKWQQGVRTVFEDWCSFCEHTVDSSVTPPKPVCTSNQAVDPMSLAMDGNFLRFVVVILAKLFILAYLIDTALKAGPQIARALSSVAYTPAAGFLEKQTHGAASHVAKVAQKQQAHGAFERAASHAATPGTKGMLTGGKEKTSNFMENAAALLTKRQDPKT